MQNTLVLNPIISLRYPFALSLKLFWIFSLISIISLLVFYVFQVNFLTREIYLIQSSEERLKKIAKENESLETDFSKSNSLANIENYLSNQNFEKTNPGQIKYIKILESEIVTK